MTRAILAAAIGEPTRVRVLDNIICDYAFMDRKSACRILVEARPVYAILGYMRASPTYISLTPIVHEMYDVIIELWHVTDWPQPPTYVADYDEILEMSADLLSDDMDEVEQSADKTLANILGFELGIDHGECPMLIEMINDDIDEILKCDHIFKRRPIPISWPPTKADLEKDLKKYIAAYPRFCIIPQDVRPSGTVNLSRIHEVRYPHSQHYDSD